MYLGSGSKLDGSLKPSTIGKNIYKSYAKKCSGLGHHDPKLIGLDPCMEGNCNFRTGIPCNGPGNIAMAAMGSSIVCLKK